ncbi:MAG: alanine--tRNA ligase, partial [Candidatus Edwardsbacteria bacterium]|nr:alanine--tRNA ligase [Candidatus Edwardsbacteria bacterium]
SSNQIRREFLDFFASKGHTIVPSASVAPADDPTLLFTNAGMNQFKKIFLGLENRSYKRAADSQKVLRVSGKHNDLEEVGRDHIHHTFFEMLGNWSFGDYYKKEAIGWAWELLTSVWKLPKDRLYATIYNADVEAAGFWRTETDIDPAHISRHAEKDNFWEMGETGPCGPCSEIHMDMGPGACAFEGKNGHACVPKLTSACRHVCGVNVDGCGRYVELWNLVFIQYNREKDAILKELPNKHIDTGLGFERLVRAMQGKPSNYDTDLFLPIITKIEELTNLEYHSDDTGISFRVIADHIRALVITIGDGVMPSNEGRGYVIRRILRRASRHVRLLEKSRIRHISLPGAHGVKERRERNIFHQPLLYKLVSEVINIMGNAYPYLVPKHEHITTVIKSEEERFNITLDAGIAYFNEILVSKIKITDWERIIPGEDVFKLYDTYGFPIDMTQVMAAENNCTVDIDGFNQCMEEQRERARAARGEVAFDAAKNVDYPPCVFVGYQSLTQPATVTGIFRKELPILEAQRGERVDITLSDTPFYGESGGQAGDVGKLENDRVSIKVLGTAKAFNQATVHNCEIISGTIKKGDEVAASVDKLARAATARHHTATHLLQAALREIVGTHVQQQGSMVSPERLRFDFTHFKALDPMQLDAVEELVNVKIMENLEVGAGRKKLAEAQAEGAMALFGEKYGDEVRVVSCGDFSKELCGGTHVHHSGEIGLFKILKEEAIASGVRRIEAVAGLPAYRYARENEMLIAEMRDRLKAGREEIVPKTNALIEQVKHLEKEKQKERLDRLDVLMAELASQAVETNGVKYIAQALSDYSPEDLREAGDKLRLKLKNGIGILAAAAEGKTTMVIAVGDELVSSKKYSANDIAKKIAAATGGKGGGRPQLAQVGGKDDGKLEETVIGLEPVIFG